MKAAYFWILLGVFLWNTSPGLAQGSACDTIHAHRDLYYHICEGQWGLIDSAGTEILPCSFDELNAYVQFHRGYICVQKDGKVGLYSLNGNRIVPLAYDNIFFYGDYLYLVKANEERLYIANSKGKIKRSTDFTWFWSGLREGYLIFRYKEKKGLINGKKGTIILPPEYTEIDYERSNYFFVRRSRLYGVVNRKGKLILPYQYKEVYYGFSEGYAPVIDREGRQCIINAKGEVSGIIDPPYYYIGAFYNGLAVATKGSDTDSKDGYINIYGKEVIPCKYDEAFDFENGKAEVYKGKKHYWINTKGKRIEYKEAD